MLLMPCEKSQDLCVLIPTCLVHFDLHLDHRLVRLLQLQHVDTEVSQVLLEVRVADLDSQECGLKKIFE
jgi:hypothetical protein